MAKSEPTKNYEDAIQKSSPKPFKNFKDVANSQDFIVDRKKAFYEEKDRNPFKITRYCQKCNKTLPISRYFTDEALICKKCQLVRLKKIIK